MTEMDPLAAAAVMIPDSVFTDRDKLPTSTVNQWVQLTLARKIRNEAVANAVKDLAVAASPFTTCPRVGHAGQDDPRMRRLDCHDDQCTNAGCSRVVRCDHPAHNLAEALAAAGGVS